MPKPSNLNSWKVSRVERLLAADVFYSESEDNMISLVVISEA